MRIVMTGASGLVGGLVIPLLGAHDLTVIGRRKLAEAPVQAQQLIGPIDGWPELVRQSSHDTAICCLGTTIRVAGSRAAFAAVDRDAAIAFAEAARTAGARQLLMVTSVGANAAAGNFYLRTKGETEAAAAALGFERVDFFRPGLLRGNRQGPARPGERMMATLAPVTDLLTPYVFDRYRSIAAGRVAAAIAACVGKSEGGTHVHENRDILALSAEC